jgi:hypothetical protein
VEEGEKNETIKITKNERSKTVYKKRKDKLLSGKSGSTKERRNGGSRKMKHEK